MVDLLKQPTLTPHKNTIREGMEQALGDFYRALGYSDNYSRGVGASNLLENTTGLGAFTSGQDAGESAGRGDWKGAAGNLAMAGLAAVPGGSEARGVAKTFEHAIGKNKLRVPLEDMRATYEAQILQGGMDFMRNKDSVWASEKGKVSTQANKIKQAGENGQPVRTVSSIMSPRSGDYSTMMANSILQQMHGAPLTKKAKAAFDADMAAKVPSWPGIDKVDENWVASAGSGRTQLAKIMEGAKHQSAGFPDIPSTRFAITEPGLLNQPTGSTGFNIATPDPFNITRDPAVPHETYNTQMGGQYFGSLDKPVPREIMFPDWSKTRPPGEPSPINDYTFERQLPAQDANQQWLDNIMKWWEQNP